MIPTLYTHKLIETAAQILQGSPDTDFYVFRHPDCPVPPLRHVNAIHRVCDSVRVGYLLLIDRDVFPGDGLP